ncbi:MAG TPA: hypothetical protein PK992_12310 [Planctomycetaceae bacterium]|nr:hypothetical protein [Planctomycetaceae bacterium]HRA88854.1 hypothetical protein [Planctomycetaceae bacterium]
MNDTFSADVEEGQSVLFDPTDRRSIRVSTHAQVIEHNSFNVEPKLVDPSIAAFVQEARWRMENVIAGGDLP